MRDSKTSFAPVVIKQEPRDPSDSDSPASPTTTTNNNNNNGYHNHHNSRLPQATAVDLRSAQTSQREPPSAMVGRRGGSDRLQAYESTEDFVAQIARRVREESNSLASLELTPVTGLGPLVAADLKTPVFTGPSSVENGGKSRGEYACGECSSRFDTARDYRAHCLTHQVLKAESMLRTSRGGSREREEREREREREESPATVFGGLGGTSGGGGDSVMSFTCEDCNARFSSRDTYAMHMLIRAKNEACFPTPSLTLTSSSALSTTNTPGSKVTQDVAKDGSSVLSPGSSLTSAAAPVPPLAGPALLLNAVTSSALQLDAMGPKSELMLKKNGGLGEGARRADNPHAHFLHSLGLDLSHVTGYSAAWWSKYMPWMAGMGLVGGVGGSGGGGCSEGEGPALPMVCYLCGELFSNRDSLAMHVLFHTRDVPSSLSDSTSGHSSWKRPPRSLPPPSLPTSSPATVLTPTSNPNAALLLGHAAALRQLQQQRSHYNSNSNISTTTTNTSNNPSSDDLRQAPLGLSPTEAAVASAAAAAVAAITPPNSTQASLLKPLGRASDVFSAFLNRGGDRAAGGQEGHRGNSPRRGGGLSLIQDNAWTGSMEVDHHPHLSPPQRGASAPIPTSTPTSPLLPLSGSNNGPFRPSASDDAKSLVHHNRPLSADHVALRSHHRPPLLLPSLADADRRRHRETSSGLWNSDNKASSLKNDSGGWRSGSDTSPPHPSSAFNVYRLQRLKKLRLAKGAYRRPGARGRPPMTIFGTAGRRPMGGQVPALTPTHPLPSPSPPSPTPVPLSPALPSSSSSSSSGRISSMVQLLTSQGHAVSACSHCEVLFGDKTLYQLHMGLHNVNNPWQCNACGSVCSSRLHFATHTLHY